MSDQAGGASAEASQYYGTIYSYEAGYAPNGNILTHTDSVMGTWNFSYDAVDRLTTARNMAAGVSPFPYTGQYGCWSYDAYGNRLSEAMSSTACNSNPTPQVWTTYNTSNNRISASSMSPLTVAAGSYGYDNSGHTLYDGNNHYWYDAEGQLCAVQRSTGGTITQYIYDAEGARIGKGTLASAPSSYYSTCAPPLGSGFTLTTRWLVDLGGDQVTELSEQGSETWAHSNIWAGGKLTATYDLKGIHFELTDPLGTKRVQANASGQVDEYCTSLPFGNDLGNNPGVNCSAPANGLNTNDDAAEHHYTGKERDSESGNDYFGARYFGSSMGRFLSPDPLMASAKAWDPQTWNRYVYGRNNPLTMIDPTGMAEVTAAQCAQDKGCATVNVNVIWDKNSNGGKGVSDDQKAAFNKNQLQPLKDQFGNADIHFNVTYSDGASSGYSVSSGGITGALNVVVSDSVLAGEAKSGMAGQSAYSFIPANSTDKGDLLTEVSHQFAGDTRGAMASVARNIQKWDKGDAFLPGLVMLAPNALSNMRISQTLSELGAPAQQVPAYREMQQNTYNYFNSGARSFQQAITPTTK
jgi:RHS repeat-associated protein